MKKSTKDYLFVTIQILFFGLYFFDFLSSFYIPITIKWIAFVVALFGLIIALVSVFQLDKNLTVFPTPKQNATLVTTGLYRFSRHPIYSGLLLFFFGYAVFATSWFKLLIAILIMLWFYLKTIFEEQQLVRKYSNYILYQKKVNRFFPRIKKP